MSAPSEPEPYGVPFTALLRSQKETSRARRKASWLAASTSSHYRCHDSLGQLSGNTLPLDKGLLKGHHPDWLQEGNLHSSLILSGPWTLLREGG